MSTPMLQRAIPSMVLVLGAIVIFTLRCCMICFPSARMLPHQGKGSFRERARIVPPTTRLYVCSTYQVNWDNPHSIFMRALTSTSSIPYLLCRQSAKVAFSSILQAQMRHWGIDPTLFIYLHAICQHFFLVDAFIRR